MTIEERLKEMLVKEGISEEQAKQAVEEMKALEENEAMVGRWQDSLEDYLPTVLLGPWLSLQRILKEGK